MAGKADCAGIIALSQEGSSAVVVWIMAASTLNILLGRATYGPVVAEPFGLLADLVSFNRQLLEMTLEKVRRVELDLLLENDDV